MSSIGTGYDLSVTIFSPDGSVFQIEYAVKAVDNSGTVIRIKCKDGIVMGVEKLIASKMMLPGSNRRIHSVHRYFGMAEAGMAADGRQIMARAKSKATNYRSVYGETIPVKELAEPVASYVHLCTLYWWLGFFGCGIILGGYDRDGPQLYMVESSDISYRYFDAAIGKGKQAAKIEIEKLNLPEMTCGEGVIEIAKIIYKIHDEAKDKSFELEMSWACDESKQQHQKVSNDWLEEAKALEEMARLQGTDLRMSSEYHPQTDDRDALLHILKHNLSQAQVRMKAQADHHRREIEFQIIARVGAVAYRLQLPETVRVHFVFHVFKLKLCRGRPEQQVTSLPILQHDLTATDTAVP